MNAATFAVSFFFGLLLGMALETLWWRSREGKG